MNIDLDSWEAGYAHGQQGRPPRCAIDLDQVSYFSGFCHGRAWRAQSRTKSTPSSDRLYSALIRYDDKREVKRGLDNFDPPVAATVR
jgi:hypothetical protein